MPIKVSKTLSSGPTPQGLDKLHISNSRSGGFQIKSWLNTLRFLDKDTQMYVCYIPALNLSGYGIDIKKAQDMAKFSLDQYFDYLSSLSLKQIKLELQKLGWKNNSLRNKDFSKSFVDFRGELQNFNVDLEAVELSTIEA